MSELPPTMSPSATPLRAEVLGIPLAVADYERVIDWLEAGIACRESGYMQTPIGGRSFGLDAAPRAIGLRGSHVR